MIVQNPEILLVIGMIGLYLYDSAMLLASNQALLCAGWKGKWLALFGADNFLVLGKELFLPNPFLPHRPLYLFSWDDTGFLGPNQLWAAPRNDFLSLAPFIWSMMVALFVIIPLGLFSRLGNIGVAAGVIIFYVSTFIALAIVWHKRDKYAITGKNFVSLAFECLTCPPFAVNLIRHLSLLVQPREDFLSVVGRLMGYQDREAALKKLILRVQKEIDWEDEGTERAASLQTHLNYLVSETEICRAQSS